MNRNDQGMYNYERFLPGHDRQQMQSNPMLIVDPDWRASIVKWVSFVHTTMHIDLYSLICIYIYLICYVYYTFMFSTMQTYNVVDHFDLNREVVAISMAIFDRFFATGIIRPSSDLIL